MQARRRFIASSPVAGKGMLAFSFVESLPLSTSASVNKNIYSIIQFMKNKGLVFFLLISLSNYVIIMHDCIIFKFKKHFKYIRKQNTNNNLNNVFQIIYKIRYFILLLFPCAYLFIHISNINVYLIMIQKSIKC